MNELEARKLRKPETKKGIEPIAHGWEDKIKEKDQARAAEDAKRRHQAKKIADIARQTEG